MFRTSNRRLFRWFRGIIFNIIQLASHVVAALLLASGPNRSLNDYHQFCYMAGARSSTLLFWSKAALPSFPKILLHSYQDSILTLIHTRTWKSLYNIVWSMCDYNIDDNNNFKNLCLYVLYIQFGESINFQ